MTVIAYALGGYRQSEWALALTILGTLRKGDLLVADRYFAAAHYFWQYQSLGLEFLTRTHQRLIVSRIKRLQSYSRNDFLGWLTINKVYRRKDPRFRHICWSGSCRRPFVSEASDRRSGWLRRCWMIRSIRPPRSSGSMVADGASRRFRAIQDPPVGRCAAQPSPDGIRKEFAARCIALNLVHAIPREAAESRPSRSDADQLRPRDSRDPDLLTGPGVRADRAAAAHLSSDAVGNSASSRSGRPERTSRERSAANTNTTLPSSKPVPNGEPAMPLKEPPFKPDPLFSF